MVRRRVTHFRGGRGEHVRLTGRRPQLIGRITSYLQIAVHDRFALLTVKGTTGVSAQGCLALDASVGRMPAHDRHEGSHLTLPSNLE